MAFLAVANSTGRITIDSEDYNRKKCRTRAADFIGRSLDRNFRSEERLCKLEFMGPDILPR